MDFDYVIYPGDGILRRISSDENEHKHCSCFNDYGVCCHCGANKPNALFEFARRCKSWIQKFL